MTKSNQAGFDVLLQSVSNHSHLIWQFVEAMTPDYIKDSDEARAVMARGAIAAFGRLVILFVKRHAKNNCASTRELDRIRALILGYAQLGLSQRVILAVSIQAEIEACKARLLAAQTQFTVRSCLS